MVLNIWGIFFLFSFGMNDGLMTGVSQILKNIKVLSEFRQ